MRIDIDTLNRNSIAESNDKKNFDSINCRNLIIIFHDIFHKYLFVGQFVVAILCELVRQPSDLLNTHNK